MGHKTWKQRIETFLLARGYHRSLDSPQSSHYEKWYSDESKKYYHLDKGGAVYHSMDGAITHSVTVTPSMKAAVHRWESDSGMSPIDPVVGF